MANPEHVKILEQGVEAWNKWRKEDWHSQSSFGLRGTGLVGTVLHGLELQSLSGFERMDVIWEGLRKVDLRGANFQGDNLIGADLRMADLRDANLSKADLVETDLYAANLIGADLTEAKLYNAELLKANLTEANLRDAHLCYCSLVSSNLTGAVLTGAKLYGTARDNWIIKNVKCTYVYWDEEGKQRSPKDRDLEPGEFERLYASMPTIEYVFSEGFTPLDPVIMARVVESIREKRPEFDIKIDSINARGLAPSIKFIVQHEDHKEPALEEVQTRYEEKIKQLESERDRYYDLVAHALDRPRDVKLINAAPGSIVATDGGTINITQHIKQTIELQKAIAAEPEGSESFGKVAKKKALDIIGGAIEDIAKGKITKAAKLIVELGKDLGPLIAKTAAFAFFKGLL